MKTSQPLRGAVHVLSYPQDEAFFEPPPLTAVQKELPLCDLCVSSAAGGESKFRYMILRIPRTA
jgi:hypothetical protein